MKGEKVSFTDILFFSAIEIYSVRPEIHQWKTFSAQMFCYFNMNITKTYLSSCIYTQFRCETRVTYYNLFAYEKWNRIIEEKEKSSHRQSYTMYTLCIYYYYDILGKSDYYLEVVIEADIKRYKYVWSKHWNLSWSFR